MPYGVACPSLVTGKDGYVMFRHCNPLRIAVGTMLVTLAGCGGLQHTGRRSSHEVDSLEHQTPKTEAADSDSTDPKAFFRNNRLAGGWSREAREVESHLGISP